jgi:hypothetical protein
MTHNSNDDIDGLCDFTAPASRREALQMAGVALIMLLALAWCVQRGIVE